MENWIDRVDRFVGCRSTEQLGSARFRKTRTGSAVPRWENKRGCRVIPAGARRVVKKLQPSKAREDGELGLAGARISRGRECGAERARDGTWSTDRPDDAIAGARAGSGDSQKSIETASGHLRAAIRRCERRRPRVCCKAQIIFALQQTPSGARPGPPAQRPIHPAPPPAPAPRAGRSTNGSPIG